MLLFAASPALATDDPDPAALRSALASKAPPRLVWSGEHLPTISATSSGGAFQIGGRCESGRPVVISGAGVANPEEVDCVDGRYTTRGAAFDPSREIVATQTLFDGSILAARKLPSASEGNERRASLADLEAVFASAQPGDRIVLEPGTYSDVVVRLKAGKRGAGDHPIVIDGRNAVTLSGKSGISVESGSVILRGLIFREVGPRAAVTISAPGVRITESRFLACGDPRRPQAECLIVRQGGKNAEIDFNSFVDSKSMSIKVRAGADGAADLPVGVSIHHNEFRDIRRLSGNGQEPIQIAGPGGGGTKAMLRTRIEHNLFYRAEGDREAVSLKGPGALVRWNVFRDMDAAPTLRGGYESIIAGNILIRTRSIRIAGRKHRVFGNVILCPRNRGSAIMVLHGSHGYGVAADNVIRANVFAAAKYAVIFAAQTQPPQTAASGNRIVENLFYLPKSGTAFRLSPEALAGEIKATNTLDESIRNAALCQ